MYKGNPDKILFTTSSWKGAQQKNNKKVSYKTREKKKINPITSFCLYVAHIQFTQLHINEVCACVDNIFMSITHGLCPYCWTRKPKFSKSEKEGKKKKAKERKNYNRAKTKVVL